MQNKYMRYQVPYSSIYNILNKLNKKRIIFFIDFQSISKGLYNKNNIFFELQYYINNNKPSNTIIEEYRGFLNNLFIKFKQYSPFFVTFYDDGKNIQNSLINSGYKSGRSSIRDIMFDDKEIQLHYELKNLYFIQIKDRFTKDNVGKVFYLHEYESDLIPYYCIVNNLFESSSNDVLNVILSTDKDLLQCCEFRNTVQCTNRFFPSQTGSKKLKIELFDDYNAISYIYEKFKPGRLRSKHIPIILAIKGDEADHIKGLKNYGPAKAVKLIEENNLPTTVWELEKMKFKNELPEVILENFKTVVTNLKMISFEEQIKRMDLALEGFK